MGAGLMARPKKGAGKGEPKAEESRVRSAVLMIRGTPEWKSWVEALASFDRSPSLNDLIDRALVSYARERGYLVTAPKR